GNGVDLQQDAAKETTTINVGSSASNFSPGQLALLDIVDDSGVDEGDCAYFKRVDHRSVEQRVEVASVDAAGGTVTVSSPLHWDFKADGAHQAQLTPVTDTTVKYAGIEHLRIQGGTNPGYNGQM